MTEQEKHDYVSGRFLTCMVENDFFIKCEKYWFEYIGNNVYIGRSDNILNKKYVIMPKELSYFVDPDDEDMINWLSYWFYNARMWKPGDEPTNTYCDKLAIDAFDDYKKRFNIQHESK